MSKLVGNNEKSLGDASGFFSSTESQGEKVRSGKSKLLSLAA